MRIRPDFLAVAFCTACGSNRVDVQGWGKDGAATVRCAHCESEGEVRGITLGRSMRGSFATAEALMEAYADAPVNGGSLSDVLEAKSA